MATTIVTNEFSSGGTINAADINQNFSDLEDYLATGLTDADFAEDAGITSSKLQDRYGIIPVHIPLTTIEGVSTGVIATPADENVPSGTTAAAATLVGRLYPEVKSGKRCYVASIAVTALELATAGTNWPKLWVYKGSIASGGILLGGDGLVLDSATPQKYTLANASPTDNPMVTIQNGDFLEFALGRDGSTDTPTIRGLMATVNFKMELHS